MSYVNFRFSFLRKGEFRKLVISLLTFLLPCSKHCHQCTKARDLPEQGQEYEYEPKCSGKLGFRQVGISDHPDRYLSYNQEAR